MITFLIIYLAGVFTVLGITTVLNNIHKEMQEVPSFSKFWMCIQSWYAFGVLIGALIAAILGSEEDEE